MHVRVRYAPSPTGAPHIGNIRTALYDFLYARHHEGEFILRIEDSDQQRLVPGSDQIIIETLKLLHLNIDEGPFYQSHTLDRYLGVALDLIAHDSAYYCFCSSERLDLVRKEQESKGEPTRYDQTCKNIAREEATERAKNEPHVIRFKVEPGITLRFNDLIHGEISFESSTLDDFVIIKSDGFPTYHLASVVDDHHMNISHVIRGDEWISSTPKHLMLYTALGYTPPLFAHLPIILGTDKTKLSKRHGATSAMEVVSQGYLPDAVLNFIALLGWNPGTEKEIFTLDELIHAFSLERVHTSPAIFDTKKLEWVNAEHLKKLSDKEYIHLLQEFIQKNNKEVTIESWDALVPVLRERIQKWSDIFSDEWSFMFSPTPSYDASLLIPPGSDKDMTVRALDICKEQWSTLEEWTRESLEKVLLTHAESLGKKELLWPVRVALSGQKNSPPIWDMALALGKKNTLHRIEAARSFLV